MTPEEFRHVFAANLHRLLDRMGAPANGHGRITFVAEGLGVTVGCAGKWLVGSTAPEPHRYADIAAFLGATYDEMFSPHGDVPQDTALIKSGAGFARLMASLPGDPSRAMRDLSDDLSELDGGALYVRSITTDDMAPYVVPGDLAIAIRATDTPENGVYVFRDNRRRQFFLRRVRLSHGGKTLIYAENPEVPVEDFDFATRTRGKPSEQKAPVELCGQVIARILVKR